MKTSLPFEAKTLLTQSMTTGVVFLDDAGIILWCNEAAETLFGASGKNLLGSDASQFFPPLHEWITKLGKETEKATSCGALVRLTPVAGTPKKAVLAALSVPATSHFLLEMTEAEQAFTLERQEQKEGLSDASRVLLRNLAHEIKNPLGGIRGAAQLLDAELKDATQREFTAVIMSEADRLRNLVDRLLTPYRDERHVTAVNLHEILEGVRNLVLAEFPAGLAILRDYDVSVPDFAADKEQLTQVFLNLLRNAAEALSEKISVGSAQITIKTRVTRHVTIQRKSCRLAVSVEVIDNGPGVDPAIREKIFYPLVTTRAHGTGLGLSLVQTYVERNGGEVELESEPGCTVFRVLLPLRKETH